MALVIQRLIEDIQFGLSTFQTHIRNSNLGRRAFDINTYAELFYVPILNEVFTADFQVLEYSSKNTVAIDLGCKRTKIAFQITSQARKPKVTDTIKKFLKPANNLINTYDYLYFLFIGKEYSNKPNNQVIQDIIDK